MRRYKRDNSFLSKILLSRGNTINIKSIVLAVLSGAVIL